MATSYIVKIKYTYADSDLMHNFTSVPLQAESAEAAEATAKAKLMMANDLAVIVSAKARANLKAVV